MIFKYDLYGFFTPQGHGMAEDNDVASERKRIETADITALIEEESLVLSGLTKFYGGFKAVDNLSIGIGQGN